MIVFRNSVKCGKQGPSFSQGVLLAAVLGFFASVMLVSLGPLIGLATSFRLLIPILSLIYVLYLLSRSQERLGRVTTLIFWAAVALLTWWFAPPLPLYLLIHVGGVWLVRSLYFHSSITTALLDFGLNGLSVATAVWALSRSGSVFLATWCFFLVQALFVALPERKNQQQDRKANAADGHQQFDRHRKDAEKALQQLFTQ